MKLKTIIFLFVLLPYEIVCQTNITVNITKPGSLGTDFHKMGGIDTLVTKLKITGSVNIDDFTFMRDNLTKLSTIDLSDIDMSGFTGLGDIRKYYGPLEPSFPGLSKPTMRPFEIPANAFAYKTTLTNVIWPKTYFSIGESAFRKTGILFNLKLPSSVTRIESNAFADCKNLNYMNEYEENTFLTIPSSVTYIGKNAFPIFSGTTIAQAVPVPIYDNFYTFRIHIPYSTTETYKENWKNLNSDLLYSESFYVVSFNLKREDDPNNNAIAVPDILIEHPCLIKPPEDPVMPQCIFKGWYLDSTYTNKWNPNDTIRSNTIIYAKWDLKSYKIHYVTPGVGSAMPDTLVKCWTVFNPPSARRTGYSFLGWYTDSVYSEEKLWDYKWFCACHHDYWQYHPKIIISDSILYAKWEETVYKVVFSTPFGGYKGFLPTQFVSYFSTKKTISYPNYDQPYGYTFAGWFKDNTYTSKWDFDKDSVIKDTTLFAKWDTNKYVVSYNSNGGKSISDTLVSYLTRVNPPKIPVKTGYVFAGWFKDSSFINSWNFIHDTVIDHITLHAKWNCLQFSVNLYKNDASCKENHGSISVDVIGGVPPYLYSINEGLNYQKSNSFLGLTSDSISIIVKDSVGCIGNASIFFDKKLDSIPEITELKHILYSSSDSGNQWCLNYLVIEDSVQQSFTPDQSGVYTVMVTNKYGCTVNSEPYYFVNTNIKKEKRALSFSVYPNPTNGEIYLDLGNIKVSGIKIFNSLGELVYYSKTKRSKINLNNRNKGTYFILISSDEACFHKKISIY